MRRRRQRFRALTPLDVIRVRRATRNDDHATLASLAFDFGFADGRALVEAATMMYERQMASRGDRP